MDVNGWSVIEPILEKNGKTQSDMARALHISPAAVTQLKQGEYRLSPAGIEKILDWLVVSPEERNELYTAVVNARFFGGSKTASVVIHR